MVIDNALDADNLSSQRYINEITSNITTPPKIEHKNVPADHEIISLHLMQIPAGHFHNTENCFPVMGIQVNSQLSAANLIPTHTTNVVNINGESVQDSKFNNKDRSDIEQTYYILGHDECKQIIDSGAYDEPNSWNRKLNDQLRGSNYSRLTHVRITKYHAHDNPATNLIGLGKPRKGYDLKFVTLKNDEPWAYFSEDTDNSFSFLLANAVKHIRKGYQETGSHYKISRAIVTYGNEEASKFTRYLTTGKVLDSNNIETDADLLTASQRDAQGVDSNGYINKNIKPANSSSASTLKDFHVTKQSHTVSNEINLSAAPESSSSSENHLDENHVTQQAQTVGNELDLSDDRIVHHSVVSSSEAESENNALNLNHYINGVNGAYPQDEPHDEDITASESVSESETSHANMESQQANLVNQADNSQADSEANEEAIKDAHRLEHTDKIKNFLGDDIDNNDVDKHEKVPNPDLSPSDNNEKDNDNEPGDDPFGLG